MREEQERINIITQKYHEFSKATGLPVKTERMQVASYHRVKTAKELKKPLTDGGNGGIIKKNTPTEVKDVHYVGKIDKNKYRDVSDNIRTDEVIITDERIQHIKERHPNDYERYCSYIPMIIESPDYIIEASKENTAVILKEIEENGEKFKLILRLAIPSDPENYKNSVISFWAIGDTTWKKTLKNKKILYKSE